MKKHFGSDFSRLSRMSIIEEGAHKVRGRGEAQGEEGGGEGYGGAQGEKGGGDGGEKVRGREGGWWRTR